MDHERAYPLANLFEVHRSSRDAPLTLDSIGITDNFSLEGTSVRYSHGRNEELYEIAGLEATSGWSIYHLSCDGSGLGRKGCSC